MGRIVYRISKKIKTLSKIKNTFHRSCGLGDTTIACHTIRKGKEQGMKHKKEE